MIDFSEIKKHKDYSKAIHYFENRVYNDFPEVPSYELFNLFWENGNRSVYEKLYFERRKQLTYLGILVKNQPENALYKNKLEKLIYSICNEFTWCLPAHLDKQREFDPQFKQYTLDLFACETAFTLAELSFLLKGLLPEDLELLIEHSIQVRILSPFLNKNWNFENLENNWSAVCTGSIGIAALYLLEEDDSNLEEILTRVNATMDVFLKGFGDDGACLEGLNYWQYGFRYFTYYIDCLNRETTNPYSETLNQEKIKNIAMYQQKMYLFDRTVINVSDSPLVIEPAHDLARYYRSLFPDDIKIPDTPLEVDKLVDHCGRWAPMIRTLQWSEVEEPKIEESQGIEWLNDAQMFIYKNQEFQVVTKGGHNDEPHNHNDLGHFILFYKETPFCIDLGAPEYTKDYFDDKRYETIQASSLGHSVPIINGHIQESGKEQISLVKDINPNDLKVVYDLTRAYSDEHLLTYHREIKVHPKKNALRIRDYFKFNAAQNLVKQRFILSDMKLLTTNSFELIFEKDSFYFKATILSGKGAFYTEPLIYKDHFGQKQKAIVLDISFDSKELEELVDIEFRCFRKEEEADV